MANICHSTTEHYVPGNLNFHQYHCDNLRSCTVIGLFGLWIFLFFAYGLFNDTVYITRQTAVSVRVIGEWWIWNVLGSISCGLCKVPSHHLLKEGGDWGNPWSTSVTISGVRYEIQTRLIFFTTRRFGSGQHDVW